MWYVHARRPRPWWVRPLHIANSFTSHSHLHSVHPAPRREYFIGYPEEKSPNRTEDRDWALDYSTNSVGTVTRLFFAYKPAIQLAKAFPEILLADSTYRTNIPLLHFTAFVATMCDPRFKLAIFEHLWKDNSTYIKRAKIHFKETYRKYQERATRQRNIEVLDTEPQDNLELDDEDDLFAGTMAALIWFMILQLRRVITTCFLKAQSITRKEMSRRFGWARVMISRWSNKLQGIIWVYLQPQLQRRRYNYKTEK